MNFYSLTSKIKHSLIVYLFFISLFFLYAIYASKLGLYIDDANFILPSIAGSIPQYIKSQIDIFGVVRILSYFYLQPLFYIYTQNSAVAHIIPFLIYMISMVLLFKILLLQGFSKYSAMLTTMLILSMPSAIEIIGWMAASHGMVVIFFFILQIYLVEKFPISKKLIISVQILHIMAILIYETTIVTPIAIAYLLTIKKYARITKKSILNYCIYAIGLMIPSVLLLVIRKIWAPPVAYDRLSEFTLQALINNIGAFYNQIANFIIYDHLKVFVYELLSLGVDSIVNNFIVITLIILSAFLILHIFVLNRGQVTVHSNISFNRIVFWLLVFVASGAAVSFQKFYLPFRLMFLPAIPLVIMSAFIIHFFTLTKIKIVKWVIVLIVIMCFYLGLILQLGMLEGFRLQYQYDQAMVKEINSKAKSISCGVNVLINELPRNNVMQESYGDYLYGLLWAQWSRAAYVYKESDSIRNTAVKNTTEGVFLSKIPESDYMRLSPMLILQYDKHTDCLTQNCFIVKRNKQVCEYE